MAEYTILRNSDLSNKSTVIVEFPVPATSNSASVPWQTIVAETRTDPGTINPRKADDAVYIAQLDAGEIVELSLVVEYDANLSNAEKVAVIDDAVTAKVAAYSDGFAATYEFYGTVRTV